MQVIGFVVQVIVTAVLCFALAVMVGYAIERVFVIVGTAVVDELNTPVRELTLGKLIWFTLVARYLWKHN